MAIRQFFAKRVDLWLDHIDALKPEIDVKNNNGLKKIVGKSDKFVGRGRLVWQIAHFTPVGVFFVVSCVMVFYICGLPFNTRSLANLQQLAPKEWMIQILPFIVTLNIFFLWYLCFAR